MGFICWRDNTCEINLMDVADRKDVRADQFEKGNITDADNLAGKYAAKSRKSAVKLFTKAATNWKKGIDAQGFARSLARLQLILAVFVSLHG